MNKKEDEQLAKLLRKKRWNKNDVERIKRLLAERKSKTRSESENRQEKIKVLWGLDEQQLKAAKNPTERKLKEQELKAKKLKELLKSVKDSTENDDIVDRISELIELAGLQDREIDYLTEFRRELERMHAHYPEQLENLRTALAHAEIMQINFPEATPNQAYESKRHRSHWPPGGLIEYEFGGAREAELLNNTILGRLGEAAAKIIGETAANREWQRMVAPTCLDEIFRGGVGEVTTRPNLLWGSPIVVDTRTNMRKLEDLFGMDRNRFPKKLPNHRMGREIVYDWCAVVQIMDFLLNEKRRKDKRPVRGRPKKVWLNDLNLRTRVLSGIEARINSLSVPEQIKPDIKAEFLAVVHPHLPDSAKK